MKKYLVFAMVAIMLFCLAACGSSGSEKVYTLEKCSFAIPSSWADNSSGSSKMYTAPDDAAGLNVSFDDQKQRTPLAERLDGYDLESASVAGTDVDVFVYQDGFFFHDFEVVRDEGAYHFTFISKDRNPDSYKSFVESIKFNG